jgi:hypothetical protein
MKSTEIRVAEKLMGVEETGLVVKVVHTPFDCPFRGGSFGRCTVAYLKNWKLHPDARSGGLVVDKNGRAIGVWLTCPKVESDPNGNAKHSIPDECPLRFGTVDVNLEEAK